MQYRVYSRRKSSIDISPLANGRYCTREFAALVDVLSCTERSRGRRLLLIQGDDSTRMKRCTSSTRFIYALRVAEREREDLDVAPAQPARWVHSARTRSVRWSHLVLTTSQFTSGR